MLEHRGPAGSKNEHDGGGHVKHVEAIAAGAADVDHRASYLLFADHRINRSLQQKIGESEDFVDALAFVMKSGQKLRFFAVSHCFGEQQRYRIRDDAGSEVKA